MRTLTRTTVIAGCAALLAGCFGGTEQVEGLGTGALLSVDYFADTDVKGFHYVLENTSCAGEAITPQTWEFNVNLADNIFPGMVQHIESVLDEQSRHLGADLFFSLEPGCYNVTAIPASELDVATGAWTPSADCAMASASGIEVVDGQTTEAPLLISQCTGDPIGAIDVTVVLNHPPVIDVEIDEKYNYECEAVEVCVTAYDPDDDPIEYVFAKESGPAYFLLDQGTPEVIGFDDGHRIWQQCATIVTRWTASYDFSVTVYDLANQGGSQVHFEDLVAEDSHADLTFPVHTNWVEEPLCFDDNGVLGPADGVQIDRYPGCSYTDSETYYCSGAYGVDPDIVAFLCDGTDLIEEALYPPCDDGPGNEIPCDGIDNDGDGDIDEGSTWGEEFTYTWGGGSHNSSAGLVNDITWIHDDLAGTMEIDATITDGTFGPTNFFEVALNAGQNPNSQGNLAMLYWDWNGGTPIITVYAYSAGGVYTSHYDGSNAPGIQAPDPIVSSLSSGFVLSETSSRVGNTLDINFTIDLTPIDNHNPAYWSAAGWIGMDFDASVGMWFHPLAGATPTYSGDWVDTVTWARLGWVDISWATAASAPVCQ